MKIKRALISCTDKTKLIDLAQFLQAHGVEILSTGGTAKLLRENGIAVKDVAQETGFPEILDGRVKTLHPKIHGGLLALRAKTAHQEELKEHGIVPIDLVVVNLYAFADAVAKETITLDEALENIDIGGPSMLRSAAKNFRDVAVVVDPKDYDEVKRQITAGELTEEYRLKLARKVFAATAAYDANISYYLSSLDPEHNFPEKLTLTGNKLSELRYGENPHQRAAFYKTGKTTGIVTAEQKQGKELSFNNILDLDTAYQCCKEFKEPVCVIVKHANPCGVALSQDLATAFVRARAADPVSSFGGIVAVNKTVTDETARLLVETFFEACIAPGYSEEALAILKTKKNLRVLKLADFFTDTRAWDYRHISGGLLVQESDQAEVDLTRCRVVTKRRPTTDEMADLDFAFTVVKYVKSNAIVFAGGAQTLGIGAGQMSRVDSVKLAAGKMGENFNDKAPERAAVMASDAFFPFRDGIDQAAKSGIVAVVQPGGSMRDDEVIDACDKHGMAMIFTGIRHFRH